MAHEATSQSHADGHDVAVTGATSSVAIGPDGVDAERGLTDAEAADRRARGLGHAIKPDTGRTYRQIVRQNLLTFLNLVLVVIGGVLIGMGLWRDAIIATGLVLINAVVGIVQEVRAKRRLDQIALLTRAK